MSKNTLKHWAEDSAFQFKALHKSADIYHYLYRGSNIMIFIIAVFTLAFRLDQTLDQVMGAIALLLSVVLFMFQKDIEKTRDYRRHADKYKNVYDQLESLHDSEDCNLEDIRKGLAKLREHNADYPISKLAHWWTNRVIKKEMNIDWLEK